MDLQAYEKEHLDLVRSSAGECCVLLKTDGSFPLKNACRIAAFGNGIRHTIKGGTGSGEVNSRFFVNIEQCLKNAGFTITSDEWLDAYDKVRESAKKKFFKSIKAEAKAAHMNPIIYSIGKSMPEPEHTLNPRGDGSVAIYVVTRDSGEGNDRAAKAGDVLLAASEIRDILYCNHNYEKFLLVLNVGGVVDLSPIKEVKNILLLSQLGVVTGDVLADILLGVQNPSGKLSTTWSAWTDYSIIGNFGDVNDTDYKEGIYVGYRYFDSIAKKPLFCFGHGKSYTSFELGEASIEVNADKVTVFQPVKNVGAIAGKEVVQVYVSAPSVLLDKPYQELAGFEKTKLLLPGEETTVEISFSFKDIASYDTKSASYILEKGVYIIRSGSSSLETTIVGSVEIKETVTVLKAKNVLGTVDFKDYVPTPITLGGAPLGSKVHTMDIEALKSEDAAYDSDYPVDEKVSALSDEDVAIMSIGSFNPSKKGFLSVIGNASPHIAGGAGETCSLLADKGIGYLTMSDGPAGLRLAKNYYTDSKGAHAVGSSMIPESMLDIFTPLLKKIVKFLGLTGKKAPKNVEIKHQYATAIPIGTAIAQSFNCELAEKYGDMVGDEMERFGINLWLAPALNIHRSILCGRNFEYYSEDPLVSGAIAAAITSGVQKHKGCGTTIKHYAANNQEINRYGCSSNVSERAMREIYLKGFGICVKRSQPHAVMTSYNLLNGTHTSEHRGLIEDILRSEYGFEGIVMTDWVIAGMNMKNGRYRGALAGEVAKAGGDLFMPGCKGDYSHLYNCLKDGSLSRKQLDINITRVCRMVEKLTK